MIIYIYDIIRTRLHLIYIDSFYNIEREMNIIRVFSSVQIIGN